jgi:hypothetical protein
VDTRAFTLVLRSIWIVHAMVGGDQRIFLGPLEYIKCACSGTVGSDQGILLGHLEYLECACNGRW